MREILAGTFGTASGSTYTVDSLGGLTFVTVSGSSVIPDGSYPVDVVRVQEVFGGYEILYVEPIGGEPFATSWLQSQVVTA